MTLRYSVRSLAKSPGFVTIAVVALGVGLGLSTTMFAVLDAVLATGFAALIQPARRAARANPMDILRAV